MKPQFRPLTLFRAAIAAGILPHGSNDRNTRRRATKAWKRHLNERGACGDFAFIAALAVTEAHTGHEAGGAQSLVAKLADLPAFSSLTLEPLTA